MYDVNLTLIKILYNPLSQAEAQPPSSRFCGNTRLEDLGLHRFGYPLPLVLHYDMRFVLVLKSYENDTTTFLLHGIDSILDQVLYSPFYQVRIDIDLDILYFTDKDYIDLVCQMW